MHENLINDINYLITFFEKYTNNNIKAVLGFDGFVDQILHVVKTRTDANNYIRMNTLKEFGEFIGNAAGLSANVEFIPIKNKLGGNGPIMSNALSTYNLHWFYCARSGAGGGGRSCHQPGCGKRSSYFQNAARDDAGSVPHPAGGAC